MLTCSLRPLPEAIASQGLPSSSPTASREVRGTITCYYDFLGNVYIFTITEPLSFIFHENWHEING